MNTVTQVQILDEAVGISHSANMLDNSMDQTILLPSMDK